MSEAFIKFLGTAGARFVMARQLRRSAGTLVCLAGRRVMLDPGPGTLVACARSKPRIDPAKLDAVLLTHGHIDHAGDATALLDAMTAGGFDPRGLLFAPTECLEGPSAVVLPYVLRGLSGVVTLRAESEYSVGPFRFTTSPGHRHAMETYGVIFRPDGGPNVGFLADTRYFDGLPEAYADADVLVINVVREAPITDEAIQHLSVEDARRIVAHVRPRKAVITHFGMTMLKAKPWQVAAAMTEELGIEVVAASDGMTLDLAAGA